MCCFTFAFFLFVNRNVFRSVQSISILCRGSKGEIIVQKEIEGDHLRSMSGLRNLVDVQLYNRNNFKKKLIVYLNAMRWERIDANKNPFLKHCEYTNCEITTDRSKVTVADAVRFHISFANFGPKPPFKRPHPDQVWLFSLSESPWKRNFSGYDSPEWTNQVNWTESKFLDSDLQDYHAFMYTRTTPVNHDYNAVFDAKTRSALWVVSHCDTQSKRELYVQRLQAAGLSVDIYGRCGSNGKINDTEFNSLPSKYKFYLSFENSLCKDYVTEKFFTQYNNNLILVTRGGSNYSSILPLGTFIDSAKFQSPESLAAFLIDLGNDRNRYIEMLKKKNKYEARKVAGRHKLCELCRKLNNLSKYRKSYQNITAYFHDGRCHEPNDI